jgi:GST-like protein
MIDLYTWATPNGRKVSIALEELGLPYHVHAIDISRGDQHTPEFTAISPNQKIPAMVDQESGIALMESGAILLYLAEKTQRLLPSEPKRRWATIQWLMWQKGGLGPMLGQAHHFLKFNPGKSSYAEERYQREAQRLYGVLERQLMKSDFIAGDEYTIADIASFPWVSRFEFQRIDLCDFPHVHAWYLRIARRPAVVAGYAVPIADQVPMPRDATA